MEHNITNRRVTIEFLLSRVNSVNISIRSDYKRNFRVFLNKIKQKTKIKVKDMVKKNKEQIEHTSVSSGSKSLKTSSLKIQKSLKPKKAQLSSSQKKRVLHIAGSGTSKYYESVSLIYGVPSFVHGPREEFEHVFAKVSIDDKEKTGRAKW